MSDKTKRRLAIAGAAVIGLALVVAIGMRFAKEPIKPDASSQEPVSSSHVAPDIQDKTEKKGGCDLPAAHIGTGKYGNAAASD